MKLNAYLTRSILVAWATAVLGGCGVGNDEAEAGSLTAFDVTPDALTFTGPNATTCGGGGGVVTRVYVYGGAGPYQVHTTLPDFVAISRSTVQQAGEFFELTLPFADSCMTDIPVVVTDKLGRQAIVTVSSVAGS